MYRSSFRLRITIDAVLILMICMALLCTATLVINYRQLRRSVLESRAVLFTSVTRELNGMLKSARELASYIAINDALQRLLREEHPERSIEDLVHTSDVRALLSSYTHLSGEISAVAVLKPNNVLVTSMTNATLRHALQALWDERFAGRKLDDALYSGVIHVPGVNYVSSDDYNVICYLMRIYDKDNYREPLGYVVLFLHYEALIAPLNEARGAFADTLLVNSAGEVLYRHGEGLTGESVTAVIHGDVPDAPGRVLMSSALINEDWTLAASVSTDAIWAAFLPAFITGLLLALGGLSLASLALVMTLRRATRSLYALSCGIEQIAQGNLTIRLPTNGSDEINQIAVEFNRMASEVINLIEAAAHQEREKNDYKFAALKMQINPHFLSNTLGAIICLTHQGEPDKVVKLTSALTSLLHDTMDWERTYTTVDEEVRMLQSYLFIQNIRYGDMFDVRIYIDDGVSQCQLPRMILQPIVENSILHGILPKEEPGTIELRFVKHGDAMRVFVKDSGVGIPVEELKRLHAGDARQQGFNENIGLRNVRDRLQMLYGSGTRLCIESSRGEYTNVWFEIPFV